VYDIVYFRSGGYVDGSIRGLIVLCNAIANNYIIMMSTRSLIILAIIANLLTYLEFRREEEVCGF